MFDNATPRRMTTGLTGEAELSGDDGRLGPVEASLEAGRTRSPCARSREYREAEESYTA